MAATPVVDSVVSRGDVAGCVLHPDGCSLFRSQISQDILTRHGPVISMYRVTSAAEFSAMKSFYSVLQGNGLDWRTWQTRDKVRRSMANWNQKNWHRRRCQDRLGRLTPIEYEVK